jgi:hypothetical protein
MYHKCKRLKNQQQYLKNTMNTPTCHNRPNNKPIFLKKGILVAINIYFKIHH